MFASLHVWREYLFPLASLLTVIVHHTQTCWGGGMPKSHSTTCAHTVKPLHDETFYSVQLEPGHVIRKREATQPIRFHLHFDQSLQQYLPRSHQLLVRSHVKTAMEFWSKTLRVRSTNKPIRLRKKCLTSQVKRKDGVLYCMDGCNVTTVCGDIVIPQSHLEGCMYYSSYTGNFISVPTLSPGVKDADFILYVATIPSGKCRENQTIAYAAHCQQEDGLDRPVAGYFSICPNSISLSRQNQQQLLSTMKHEILHALGFTAGLYAFYRDDYGNPRTPRPLIFQKAYGMHRWSSNVIREVIRPNWVQKSGVIERRVLMMVTPRVRDEVRRHFNCSILEGAELENQGIDGTALTHWEKRVFENEAMTGTYTENSIISRITLAMMEDTGWYKANYSQAGNYEWGKNLGCEFVQNSCYNWISTRQARGESIHPFCDQVKQGQLWTDCALNRHSVSLCNLIEYGHNMPAKFQYFDTIPGISRQSVGRYAGSVELADYCPYLQEFSWTNEANVPVRGSNCQDPHNNLDIDNNFFGEEYGESSLCFEHASRWYMQQCGGTVRSPQHAGSGCYRYSCHKDLGLSIHLSNVTYRCYHKNQVVNVAFVSQDYIHQGTIVCPGCREICGSSMTCPPEKLPPETSPRHLTAAPCRGCLRVFPGAAITILIPAFVLALQSLTFHHDCIS